MTLKEFTEGIKLAQESDSFYDKLRELHIDIIDSFVFEGFNKVLNLFFREYFSEEGFDLICWWLYENVPKVIYYSEDTIFGKEEYKISLNTIEDLWNYLNSDKIYLKNGSTSSK